MNLFKNRSGAIKGAMLILTLAFIVASVSYIIPVFAEHTATVTITPDIANCDVSGFTFTVNVENDLSSVDDIFEVRIYDDSYVETYGILEFYCGPAPEGWQLYNHAIKGSPDYYGYCEYKTQQFGPYVIEPGEDVDFTFDAIIFQEACYSRFLVSTLDNKYPTGQHQYYTPEIKIDCVDPVIDKILKYGSGIGVCPPDQQSGGDVCWIRQSTCVEFDAYDTDDQCDLGLDYCDWSYTVDGVQHESGKVTTSGHAIMEICFDEDSVHVLNITCVDKAKNVNEEIETFKVDDTPPTTQKSYGTPTKVKDGYRWITSDTSITLTSVDGGQICAIGVDKIYWRNTLLRIPDNECIEDCFYQGLGTWNEQEGDTVTFYKMDDSCHLIEFYAVDELGNQELHHKQCVFVDNKPPLSTKQHGTPFREDSGFDWVNQSTKITLDCMDQEPHPVDQETLYWRFSKYDNPNFENPTYTAWHAVSYLDLPIDIYFQDDCWHDIEYYCVDHLGNDERELMDGQPHRQYYIVDSQSPVIKKTLIGPWSGDCLPEDTQDICYIDGVTKIHVEVEDPTPHPSNEVECSYEYTVEPTGAGGGGTVKPPFNITFPEESKHTLTIRCWDALGNEVEDTEVFYVDKTPPETTKWYEGPQYPEAVAHPTHITSETEVHLEADDVGPHDSGVAATYYRDVYLPDPNDWIYCYEVCGAWNPQRPSNPLDPTSEGWKLYTGHFHKTPDSCHIIEYYSVDNVDKVENIKWQCVFVDNTAPTMLEKSVGEPKVEKDGKIYITKETPIMMRCKDEGDHPVNHVSLWYRYRFADDCDDLGQAAWEDPSGYCKGNYDGDWCDPTGEEKVIYFSEDSCHELEYYCVDALGNEAQHVFEIDVVDTKPPVIKKTLIGPWSGDCLPEDTQDICYIDGVTKIHVEAEDPEPHPVNEVNCSYEYIVDPTGEQAAYSDLTPPFNITFPQESEHTLWITCCDALGNCDEDEEVFIVDKTPPGIEKWYGEPFFSPDGNLTEWISSTTPVYVKVSDDGDHPTGIKKVEYRTTVVDDRYCQPVMRGQTNGDDLYYCEDAVGSGDWETGSEDFNFTIGEDSCHLIEIFAIDNVDKNVTHKQCVFVDNQAPEPFKTVGEPKGEWHPTTDIMDPDRTNFYPEIVDKCWSTDPEKMIECWKVTMMTPISLGCIDPEPHPVDHEIVCFNIEVDACDETEDYCEKKQGLYNESGDGYCCLDHTIENFMFDEETEHNLKYYCVDQLGNKGEKIDEEKFKVEGTVFEIPLYKKWNLISVPFVLLEDDPEAVFDKFKYEREFLNDTEKYLDSVWAYDPEDVLCGEDWCLWTPDGSPDNLDTITPGWGYWVLIKEKPEGCEEDEANNNHCFIGEEEPLWLVIGGSLFSPATIPPSRDLVKGWNLIGYYGTSWQLYPWSDANFMCGDAFKWPDKWIFGDKVYCALNSLVDTQEGYPRWSSVWSYVNCGAHQTFWLGLNTCIQPYDKMYAGRGYWLELDVPDQYAPASTCIWNSDFQCV